MAPSPFQVLHLFYHFCNLSTLFGDRLQRLRSHEFDLSSSSSSCPCCSAVQFYLSVSYYAKKSGTYRLTSSSNDLQLEPPYRRTRTTLGDSSFKVAAPKLWNAQPHEMRSISDVNTFKRHLKTNLLYCMLSIFLILSHVKRI